MNGRVEGPTRGTDLRLAGTSVGCWLAALCGLRTTATAGLVVALVAALAAAAVGVLVHGRRRPRWPRPVGVVSGPATNGRCEAVGRAADAAPRIVVAVLLGVLVGAIVTAARVAERDGEPLAAMARRHASMRAGLVVRDDPRPVAGARGADTVVMSARLRWIEAGDTARFAATARVLVLASGAPWRALLPGQRIELEGRLAPARGGDLTAAVIRAGARAPAVDVAPWYQRAAGGLRAGLRRACAPLPAEPGGLLPGLVIGDTTRLDPSLADDFRTTGMTHLYAVSGSNCAIVVGAVLLLARWSRAGPRLSAALCALALVGFVILARPSPSVLRAAAMGGLALVALAWGRPRAAVPALATVVIALIATDPDLAGDAGFALSVLATGGLLLLAPRWAAALRRRRVPAGIAEALAVSLAAQVACAPVVAALSSTVSLSSVPANLLAAPAVAPATVLGVVAALASPLWPSGARYAAWLASWPARWLVWLAHTGSATPGGSLGWPGGPRGGVLLAVVLLAALLLARRVVRSGRLRRVTVVMLLATTAGVLPSRLVGGWPPPHWLLVACDVGQGDAIVLAAGPRDAVVIDTGPQPGPTDRCLRSLKIDRVSLLLITHFHSDHVGGVRGVTRGRAVAAVVVPSGTDPPDGRGAVLEAARRAATPVRTAVLGEEYLVGAVRLSVLGPSAPLRGTRSDPNNNSLVLRAAVGGWTALLAGDAEIEGQRLVMSSGRPDQLRADIVKVAHHGSKYQEPRFLADANPAVAIVSVGRGNRFGHPDAEVLARLRRDGVLVTRTDRGGAVAVVERRGRLAVVRHRAAPTARAA